MVSILFIIAKLKLEIRPGEWINIMKLFRNDLFLITGHSLNHDFKVLEFMPADDKVRDLTRFSKYKNQFG